jgi:hypothetical protein
LRSTGSWIPSKYSLNTRAALLINFVIIASTFDQRSSAANLSCTYRPFPVRAWRSNIISNIKIDFRPPALSRAWLVVRSLRHFRLGAAITLEINPPRASGPAKRWRTGGLYSGRVSGFGRTCPRLTMRERTRIWPRQLASTNLHLAMNSLQNKM